MFASREEADALARQLVAAGWDGWKAGMLVTNDVHAWDPMGDPSRLMSREYAELGDRPCLLDDATADLLAVEVCATGEFHIYRDEDTWYIEELILIAPVLPGQGEGVSPKAWHSEHLGIAAASARIEQCQSRKSKVDSR